MKLKCFNCNHGLNFAENEKILRSETCPSCDSELHICKMCHSYDTSSYNQCREPQAERILDKEKKNFCDYFQISSANKQEQEIQEELSKSADALFKD